jgi:AraC family ethanolamine operon transcriptional activator
VPGNSRRHFPFDQDLELLPRPVPGWDAEWVHLGHGPVSNDAMRAAFGSGSFAVFQTSSAGILRGTNAADTVAFLASLPATNLPRSHAQVIGGDSGLTLPPGASFDLYLPEGSGILIFALPASSPAAATDAAQEVQTAKRRVLDKTQTTLLARCVESLDAIRAAAASSRQVSGTHRALLQTAAAALFTESFARSYDTREPLQRHRAVARACAFIDTNLRASIALADLCAAAGVCTRALEYGFRDFYELGPMAYVRNLRLCRVRHDLQVPGNGEDSVSSAARRWSFTHMGQFSHDYRVLFGEMPSQTLARRRGESGSAMPRERKLARSSEPRG